MASVSQDTAAIVEESEAVEPGAPPFPVRRFSVEEYYELLGAGFFDRDHRFELLEGWIVPDMTRNPPHNTAMELADEAIRPLLRGRGWHLRNRGSARTEDSVPEPDLAVARGAIRDYSQRHPRPDELALVVEVSDSSVSRDRSIKKRIYARSPIPCYWIINLVNRQVEVYTDPSGPADRPTYRDRRDLVQGQSVPLIFEGREIGQVAVSDLMP